MVSTVNGILEAVGYSAAAGANLLFAFLVDGIGWRGIVTVWALLMAAGAMIGHFKFQKKSKA